VLVTPVKNISTSTQQALTGIILKTVGHENHLRTRKQKQYFVFFRGLRGYIHQLLLLFEHRRWNVV